ncbi:MAG: S8 family serine peptidase, partial [bacterium]
MIISAYRAKTFIIMFSSLSSLLFFRLLFGGEYDWMKPGYNVDPERVWIKLKPEFSPLQVNQRGEIAYTGHPELDMVAERLGIYRIEKTFAMESSPTDPKVPDLSRYYTAYFPSEIPLTEVLEAYENCPQVEFAEWVPIARTYYTPNDPRFRGQWHLSHLRLPEAWNISRGSPEVVIGIVDSGIDMPFNDFGELEVHEDLADNLWVNPGEDIDNDGQITLDDWNGTDDDRNGFVDDFWGWDLTGRDNHPHDIWARRGGWAHGTHVAGDASAVTDNDRGISSPGFNCRLMIAGCYSPRNDSLIENGYNGIEYCARNRAHIINISWGQLSPSNRGARDVINYARSQGSIIFAAVGNDNVQDRQNDQMRHYPAAYEGVIGVAASNDNDRKASFSNYGDVVDIVAPGVSILSTFTNNSYISYDGTSMASPVAAGVGALMLSILRLNEAELLQRMQATAVDISANNQNYPGIRFRLDAAALLGSTRPQFHISDIRWIDEGGDNDGRPDPGEVVTMSFTLTNTSQWTPAYNVRISVESNDPALTWRRENVPVGNLLQERSVTISGEQAPQFEVRRGVAPHYAEILFHISSTGVPEALIPINTTIGQPYYLLVDDDNGSSFETYYQQALDNRPLVFDKWNVAQQGEVSLSALRLYRLTIWFTGNARNPLSEGEQTAIRDYLSSGGNLILSGQFIGDDLGNTDFHRQVLKSRHTVDNGGGRQLLGAEGSYVQGMRLLLVGGTGAGNGSLSPSVMEPLEGASALFSYDNGAGVGGIIYTGDYNLIYLGFALESVSGLGGTTSLAAFLNATADFLHQLEVPSSPVS